MTLEQLKSTFSAPTVSSVSPSADSVWARSNSNRPDNIVKGWINCVWSSMTCWSFAKFCCWPAVKLSIIHEWILLNTFLHFDSSTYLPKLRAMHNSYGSEISLLVLGLTWPFTNAVSRWLEDCLTETWADPQISTSPWQWDAFGHCVPPEDMRKAVCFSRTALIHATNVCLWPIFCSRRWTEVSNRLPASAGDKLATVTSIVLGLEVEMHLQPTSNWHLGTIRTI